MFLDVPLEALEATPIATAIREGATAFPWLESVHVVAIVVVVGVVIVMDMRLLGIATHSTSVRRVLRDAVPVAWVAFATALVTGGLLFASSAVDYAANPAFCVKMAALLFAGVNMLVFHGVSLRQHHDWDGGSPNRAAKVAGLLSLVSWLVVVAAGRWIGFMN